VVRRATASPRRSPASPEQTGQGQVSAPISSASSP
jgi:hypothetical protein